MSSVVPFSREGGPANGLPLWREAFAGLEALLLRSSPVYYGLNVPRSDESGVILIPGFLGMDAYLMEMYAWLHRLGYRPYYSGIGINAECPNLMIRSYLNATMDRVRRETKRKFHIIGHSLGGLLAMAAGAQRPDDVASVITLGAPFRGNVAHPNVLLVAELVRRWIKMRNGDRVLPDCYTGACPCDFVESLTRDLPESVMMSAVYTRTDSIVDWRYCVTGDPGRDFETPGTHIGLTFNPVVYGIIARRLAAAQTFHTERERNKAQDPPAFRELLRCVPGQEGGKPARQAGCGTLPGP
jgi:pimeloyl-ACP methyl ester carboxylesterase